MGGQKDAWACSTQKDVEDWLCSGLVLLEPSEETYWSLRKYAETTSSEWWKQGDQKLIRDYFKEVLDKPVKLLNLTDAAFGKCLSSIPSILGDNLNLPLTIPAFVHKSSVQNECFSFITAKQLVEIDGSLVNTCQYHPLGPYWRDLFCEALLIIGSGTNATDVFCDDFLYYLE